MTTTQTTTSATGAGSAGGEYTDASMIYSKRAAEKRDLQNLNERLDYYVKINKCQHKDYLRMKQSLASAQGEFNAKIGAKNELISSRSAAFGQEREGLSASLGDALGAANSAEAERTSLQGQYGELTHKYVNTDRNVQAAEAALGEVATALKSFQANLDKSRRDLNSRETQSATLNQKLSEVNRDIDGVTAVTNNLSSQLSDTQARFQAEQERRNAETADLTNAIAERKDAQRRLEEDLRQEFQDKLNAFVADKAKRYEAEKGEWMNIFKDEYNVKIQAYKQQNRQLGQQIREAHVTKQKHHDDILSRKSEIAQLTQERRAVEVDIDTNRRNYEATNKVIRDLKAALARKSQEFDELLAARVGLEAEVAKYAAVVAGEEGRLNVATNGASK